MKKAKPDTILTHAGCNPGTNHGIVNPPVYHASTVLFPTVEALEDAGHSFDGVRYGRIGTPTSQAFETAIAELEGGYKAVTAPSGLAAITTALLAFVSAGDHILVSDSVYGPNRLFCTDMLTRMGVDTEFYDPLIGAGISRLMRPNTRVVFVESPGSLTFEIQDVPAIAAAAKEAGAVVMLDNTWATPLFFRPFDHGVDLSIHAATKYIVGHSDAMLGVITTRTPELWNRLKRYAVQLGTCAGPDDIYLGPARPADHGRPAQAASGPDRHRTGPVAPEPPGGGAPPPPCLARRSRPCALAARFLRGQRLVRDGVEAGIQTGDISLPERHGTVRHGL